MSTNYVPWRGVNKPLDYTYFYQTAIWKKKLKLPEMDQQRSHLEDVFFFLIRHMESLNFKKMSHSFRQIVFKIENFVPLQIVGILCCPISFNDRSCVFEWMHWFKWEEILSKSLNSKISSVTKETTPHRTKYLSNQEEQLAMCRICFKMSKY